MRYLRPLVLILGSIGSIASCNAQNSRPSRPTVMRPPVYNTDPERANHIVEAFKHSWYGYYKYAYPRDTLHPLTETFENDGNSFGATAFDSLTTAIIMGDAAIVNRILSYITSVNFTFTKKVREDVNVFRSTVRYIGSMVSASDLLNGPFKYLGATESQKKALLDQATNLADMLKISFDTKSLIPCANIRLSPKRTRTDFFRNTLAGAGSLFLEWIMLAERTGLKNYEDFTHKAFRKILRLPKLEDEVVPGLFPERLNTNEGAFFGSKGGWTEPSSAFYKAMIKLYNLNPKDFSGSGTRWLEAAGSTYSFDMAGMVPYGDSYTCSVGGSFIYGGAIFKRQDYIDFGLALTETCWSIAKSMPAGLPPHEFRWVDAELTPNTPRNPLAPPEYEDLAAETGIWPVNPEYRLRGDVFESMYYAYRMTGDTMWQDRAWDLFKRINATCRVDNGFTGLRDVTVKGGRDLQGNKVEKHSLLLNRMEPAWMSETLKYLYL
ncbi:hypothetical protein FZEAL_9628, partial [Fusarium zealandicum]